MQIDLNGEKPIYRQIGEAFAAEVLAGRYGPGDRVPPVRELALALRINPNTVARAYRRMQQQGLLESRPGGGNFIAAVPPEALAERRREALREELDSLLRRTAALGIAAEEVSAELARLVRNGKGERQ